MNSTRLTIGLACSTAFFALAYIGVQAELDATKKKLARAIVLEETSRRLVNAAIDIMQSEEELREFHGKIDEALKFHSVIKKDV